MKNYVQPGSTITVAASDFTLGGDVVILNNLAGVAANTAAAGEDLDLSLVGVFDLPKVAIDAFAIGTPVYWHAASKLATTEATGNTRLGTAIQAAAGDSATVRVRLLQS